MACGAHDGVGRTPLGPLSAGDGSAEEKKTEFQPPKSDFLCNTICGMPIRTGTGRIRDGLLVGRYKLRPSPIAGNMASLEHFSATYPLRCLILDNTLS